MKIFWTLSLLTAAACSGGIAPPDVGPIPSMLITNRSQYALNELRIHSGSEYLAAANVLTEPLAVEGELMFYGLGEQYFTVLRERAEHGKILAFTTREPVELIRSAGYTMVILDEAFRIERGKYRSPDSYAGVIIGDPGPPCEWTTTATKSDCSTDVRSE